MTMGLSVRKCSILYRAVCFVYFVSNYTVLGQNLPKILNLSAKGEVGKDARIVCSLLPENATVEWYWNGAPIAKNDRVKETAEEKSLDEKDLDGNIKKYKVSNLTITNATSTDAGNYTCVSKWMADDLVSADQQIVNLDLSFPAKLLKKTEGPIKRNATESTQVILQCGFEIYNTTEVKWLKRLKDEESTELETKAPKQINLKTVESSYEFTIKRPEDNGTYVCQVWDSVTQKNITGEVDVFVYASPKVIIDTVKAISATQIYLNWTVHAYNLPIRGYTLMYRKLPSSDFSQYTREKIGTKNTSFVMEGLDNSTEYQVRLEVATTYGSSTPYIYPQTVKTLAKDPIFVPNISINGFSATSVTIGWIPPPEDIAEFIHYYLLEARKFDEVAPKRAYHSRDSRNLPYMFDDLEPHSTYVFRVCACSEFTKKCGNWSLEMEAITLDGVPTKPSNVTVRCIDGDQHNRFINVTWEAPLKPNAEIKGYSIELTGNATYRDRYGQQKVDTWGPLSKFVTNVSRTVRMDELKPNTRYTVRVSAMTRTRRRGEEEVRHCSTSAAAPDSPPRPRWRKIVENEKYMFKMLLQRISERNGPICCYRVYMVRLPPNMFLNNLPPPKDINVISYEQAHAQPPLVGAYITDVFSNEKFPPESELVMGDSKTMVVNALCPQCMKKPKRPYQEITTPSPKTTTSTTPSTTTKEDVYDLFEEDSTAEPEIEVKDKREKRAGKFENRMPTYFLNDAGDYWRNPMMMDSPAALIELEENIEINDGPLDTKSNYTMFVELISGVENEDPMYSNYLNELMPAPSPPVPRPFNILEIILQVTCGILAVVLLGMFTFCVMHSRRSRKMNPIHAHVEMNPIHAALRYIEQVLSSGRGTPPTPPELPPIPRDQLAAAYAERAADSDYGFQKEFEMLPECFPDRTTHASDARENQPKNRYPDIKAYDQTRVKLSQIDSIVGSDYINANFVMGYKDPSDTNQEHKQFICAQGPTDATVNDFWRMIWEHGLELVVMLTNLEEYSKVKCSKYWPDEVRGTRVFNNISVQHVSEKRYSDYIVRDLKVTKLQTTAEGQPIVENNGVKRNGDIIESHSVPTSPRENGSVSPRLVRQYHFLQWKDFAAPEHTHSILAFIKRVNEAHAQLSCRPLVVHCSAGVGRTGTLVALHCLIQQLTTEQHAAVFSTVAELRRQRNFLVQSLKQYIFVYRALVEYAHYGDTEIPASKLKTAVDRLRNTPEGADKCLMEHEFEKIINSPLPEIVKTSTAGEEVRNKNRSSDCVPYDRNRVFLAPLTGKDFSTYINASFIEAYDHTEGFIITQDPLPNTIGDFWRMVAEHNVSTIVMLSELGEGKCPRYWDDETAHYDHISVHYEESESCPYYTRRQFRVTNNKSSCSSLVSQLQYHGWPTARGHVPEVTRGLAELADEARERRVMLVHCQYGTERSAMFVALCILINQLRSEKRVDLLTVARTLRAQRANTINTFVQYEFLYRAILNYAELHNLMDDS